MTILVGLEENYNNVFSTLTKRMLNEIVALDDIKDFLLIHECIVARVVQRIETVDFILI